MERLFLRCLIGAMVLTGASLSAVEMRLDDSAELRVRGGLPNAGAKLEREENLTVVFIGGSITRGGGESGYVSTVEKWLRERWPNSEINVMNAGISGTDSNFGAKRYDRDVLIHEPDLVLIEFAVNDGSRDHTAPMERMLHKTWLKNPETDIVFFYTLSRGHLDNYKGGKMPIAASYHERVAKHYNIPSIGLAHAVAAKINNGEIAWEQFANDAVHPHAGGYAMFNEVFKRTLPILLAVDQAAPHELKPPITDGLQVYPEPIRTIPLTPASFTDNSGEEASASFSVPVPALNWVEEAEFQDDSGRTIWRLHWMDKNNSSAMDENVGLDKDLWEHKPMVWFGEDKSFTGTEGNALFQGKEGGTTTLGFAGHEVGVLVFVAPETGTYAFRVSAAGLSTWKNEDTDFAFNVAKFSWGEKFGESLVHFRAKRRDIEPFSLEGETHLTAGEEIVVIIASDSPGHIRGGWEDFRLDIGLMKSIDCTSHLDQSRRSAPERWRDDRGNRAGADWFCGPDGCKENET